MIRKILFPCAFVLAIGFAGACDDELAPEEDAGIPPVQDAGPAPCTTLTYANFGKPLLDSKCVSCHSASLASGGVSLDTLAGIRTYSEHIIEHAVDLQPPVMPYNQPALPQADRDKLEQWVNCGAP